MDCVIGKIRWINMENFRDVYKWEFKKENGWNKEVDKGEERREGKKIIGKISMQE